MVSVRIFLSAVLLLLATTASAAERPRALFVSMIQDSPVLESRESIEKLVSFAEKNNFGILFIQVHRENKSWFPSVVADDTFYREASKKLGADPLAVLIQRAHRKKIEVHAWINLMSLGANKEAPLLKKYGSSILTRSQKSKKSLEDYKIDGQFFMEPGDPRVLRSLETLVGEVAERYPSLDGVQFDYIRYPDWESVAPQGEKWNAWKEKQVTTLLKKLRHAAHRKNPKLQVSTTGLMPYSRAHLEAYQNWSDWMKTGAADFVTLMAYARTDAEFEKFLDDAKQNGTPSRALIGVGAYFFTKNSAGFKSQWNACEQSDFKACAFFHYGNTEENSELEAVLAEKESS